MASHGASADPRRLILTPIYHTLVFKGSFPPISAFPTSSLPPAKLPFSNNQTSSLTLLGARAEASGFVIRATYRIGRSGMATEGDAYDTSLNGTRSARVRASAWWPLGTGQKLRAAGPFCENFAQQHGVFQVRPFYPRMC